jgi:uncharacterized protein YecE (DUF72 family)
MSVAAPIRIRGCELRVGTASWTDPTMTARGVFYPDEAKSAESRLRYYASRFSMVEADVGFYAIPDARMTERWVERTPPDFVFDVKAHALMTGHPTDVARLPRRIREELPKSVSGGPRVYASELPRELELEAWRLFRIGIAPLAECGRLGAIFLQYPPWIVPDQSTPAMLARAREQLGDLPIAVEFRHPSWLEPRLRERLWAVLREQRMSYVVPDTPPGTATSMPIVAAVTTPELAVVRLHGRRSELWGARDTPVVEKYRYLYDEQELAEWLDVILGLVDRAERLHVVFNNCYANYGTTNALEMAELLGGRR